MGPTNRYLVSMKATNLTPSHLELHKSIFNPDIKPDYFAVLENNFDLLYTDTVLMNKKDFVKADLTQNEIGRIQVNTGSRVRVNPKSDEIGSSLTNIGLDLREKPALGYYLDGRLYIFGGNTVYEQLGLRAAFDERLVAIFELKPGSNKSLVEAALDAALYTNLLGLPFGKANEEDLEARIESKRFDPDNFEEEFNRFWTLLGCDKVFTKSVKARLRNKKQMEAGLTEVESPASADEVLQILRDRHPGKYEDDIQAGVTWKVYSCESYPAKYMTFAERTYKELYESLNGASIKEEKRNSLTYREMSDVKQNTILYYGLLTGLGAAEDLVKTHIKKYNELLRNIRAAEQILFSNGDYDPEEGYAASRWSRRAIPVGVYVQCSGLESYGYNRGDVLPMKELFVIDKKMQSERLAAEEEKRNRRLEMFLDSSDFVEEDAEEDAD